MRRTLALLGVTALLLTGCEAPAVYGPSPIPSSPPIFATEEEAMEAAEVTLESYVAAVNRMSQSGGEDMSGYDGIVSDHQFADEEADAAALRAAGRRLVGDLSTFGFRLQQLDQSVPGAVYLQSYVCLDISTVTYIDAEGKDLSAENRAPALPEEVIFYATDDEPRFVVEEVRKWTGRDFCASE